MMLMLIDSLPVRSSYQRGESLAGYVYRVHSENGHKMPKTTMKSLHKIYRHGYWGPDLKVRPVIEQLLGGRTPFTIKDWAWHWKSMWSRYVPRVARSNSCSDRLILCPVCVAANGKHLGMWETPLSNTCPVHRCRLKSTCDSCSSPLQWSRVLADWHCRCGFKLSEARRENASLVEYMQALTMYAASDLLLPDKHEKVIRYYAAYAALPYALKFESLYILYGLRRLIVERLFAKLKLQSKFFSLRDFPIDKEQLYRWESYLVRRWPYDSERALLDLAYQTGRFTFREQPTRDNKSPIWQAAPSIEDAGYLDDAVIERFVNNLMDIIQTPLSKNTSIHSDKNPKWMKQEFELWEVRSWWSVLNGVLPPKGMIAAY